MFISSQATTATAPSTTATTPATTAAAPCTTVNTPANTTAAPSTMATTPAYTAAAPSTAYISSTTPDNIAARPPQTVAMRPRSRRGKHQHGSQSPNLNKSECHSRQLLKLTKMTPTGRI